MRLCFGQCAFDTGSRQLWRDGAPQAVSPKAFQLLAFLLQARPRAVSKHAIRDELWPRAFVSDSSLPRLAAEIRAAIGDDAKKPRLLRTVHRFGYSFVGAVTVEAVDETSAPPYFRVVWGERQIPLLPGENILGRSAEARVPLDLGRVSRHHARIVVGSDRAVLEDMGSKNGTFVRGERVTQPEVLEDGDEICIGPVVLVFRTSLSNRTTESST
ncbi:MAG TPA: FHA domain-containing protein [Vicinamibacteria bacterium]|nr:FHA domain-containing protein [Vicinamibacteria bacterium]